MDANINPTKLTLIYMDMRYTSRGTPYFKQELCYRTAFNLDNELKIDRKNVKLFLVEIL